MAHPVHRHLALLHGFQQGRLGTGGGTVQFIRQEKVAQHRAGLVLHLPRPGVRHTVARNIRGEHVRRKLHPAVLKIQNPGKGQGHGGLPHTGNVLQEDVTPGQDGRQYPQQHRVLSHHCPTYLTQHLLDIDGHFIFRFLHCQCPFP